MCMLLDGFTYWLCKVLVHIFITLCSEFAQKSISSALFIILSTNSMPNCTCCNVLLGFFISACLSVEQPCTEKMSSLVVSQNKSTQKRKQRPAPSCKRVSLSSS